MATLPAIDSFLRREDRRRRRLLWTLFGLSVLIQLGGVLISDIQYLDDLYLVQGITDAGRVIWQFGHAPIWVHWRLLFGGAMPNLAAALIDTGEVRVTGYSSETLSDGEIWKVRRRVGCVFQDFRRAIVELGNCMPTQGLQFM